MKTKVFFLSFFALFLLASCKQPEAPSNAAEIMSISEALGSKLLELVDADINTYRVRLPQGTNLESLSLEPIISKGAQYKPHPPQDFSDNTPIKFTVTAEDGTTQEIYNISVGLEPSTDTGITSIGKELDSKPLEPVDLKTNAYKVIFPHGTDLSDLDLDIQLASNEANYVPQGAQDFSKNNPIKFTVTAEDGTTQEIYNISVGLAPSTDTGITSIGKKRDSSKPLEPVDLKTNAYKVIFPHGTDLSDLDLDIQLASNEANYVPQGAQDFSKNNPIKFTVTAEDGTTQEIYNISVELAPSTAVEFTSIESITEVNDFQVKKNDVSNSFIIYIQEEKVPSDGFFTIKPILSKGASHSPQEAQNFSAGPVTFTVTAQDTVTKKIYTVSMKKIGDPEKPRMIKTQNRWVVAEPQNIGTHTGIWTIEDLVRMGSEESGNVWQLSSKYVLMVNLDFTNDTDYLDAMDQSINADDDAATTLGIKSELTKNDSKENKGFNPIRMFTGSLEGNRKTISHLYINRPQEENVGLVGYAQSVSIRRLGLLDVDIVGNDRVGSIVGYHLGRMGGVDQVYSTGIVSGKKSVGGLVGFSTGEIEKSYTTVKVESTTAVASLLGSIQNGVMKNCIAFSSTIKTISEGKVRNRIVASSIYSTTERNYGYDSMIGISEDSLGNPQYDSPQGGINISKANFKDAHFYSQSNFSSAWDFTAVWEIKTGGERPTFIGNLSDDGLLGF